MEHSLLPWGVDKPYQEAGVYIQAQDTSLICRMDMGASKDEQNANAAYIIKACNNFEAMGNTLSNILRTATPHSGMFLVSGEAVKEAMAILVKSKDSEGLGKWRCSLCNQVWGAAYATCPHCTPRYVGPTLTHDFRTKP